MKIPVRVWKTVKNPYKMRKLPLKLRYRVTSKKRGKVKVHAKSTTKKKAESQLRLLRGVEHGMVTRKNPRCEHPREGLRSGIYVGPDARDWMWVGCSKCRKIVSDAPMRGEALELARRGGKLVAGKHNPLTRSEAADIQREAQIHRRISQRLDARGESAGSNYYAGVAEGMRDVADQYREHYKRGTHGRRNPAGKIALRPPVPGAVLIYDRVISIKASKAGMKHDCDDQCKKAGHRYTHVGIGRTAIWGMPNKKTLIFQSY